MLFATCVPAANVRATLGSVGVALPFTEIRIAADGDDPGDDLREDRRAAGATGEARAVQREKNRRSTVPVE